MRGLSEAIGGPVGDHAVAAAAAAGRFWTATRIMLALACLTLALHWVQKSPCQDGAWQNNSQYTRFCYTDVLALYYAEGLNEGKVPYRDHPVEYPVVTGYFMGALGLPVHAVGADRPDVNQGQWFYNLNALVLGALAVATVAAILALRRRRPWDAAMFALSPALLLTATVNWDLLAVGFAAFGVLAWARRHPVARRRAARPRRRGEDVAAVHPRADPGARRADRALACGAGHDRHRRRDAWCWSTCRSRSPTGTAGCGSSSSTTSDRSTGARSGTSAATSTAGWTPDDPGPFQWLSDNVPSLNTLSYALFGLACLGIAGLALFAPRRPRLAALAFLVVAAFLIFSKVWSQQFVLWLLPLVVLARPRWWAFLAWQFAEVCYFARSTASCSAPPASRSSRRASSCSRRRCGSPPW